MARSERFKGALKDLKLSIVEIIGVVIYLLVFSAFLSMVLFFLSVLLDMVVSHV